MKCLVGMSKVNAPCNSIVEILWCGSAAAKAHVCVRTYVMTASASADLKELPLLRSSFDMIQKFRVAAAQCKKICSERLNWPGRLKYGSEEKTS